MPGGLSKAFQSEKFGKSCPSKSKYKTCHIKKEILFLGLWKSNRDKQEIEKHVLLKKKKKKGKTKHC